MKAVPPVPSFLALCALLPALAHAQAAPAGDPLDGLVKDSPFLAPAGGGARSGGGGDNGPLELKGVVFEEGTYSFSIYDQGTHESTWVRLKEGGNAFVAQSFDREKDTLTVDQGGRSLVLALQPAKTAAMASNGVSPTPLPTAAETQVRNGVPNQNPNGNSPVPNISPDEAQRLQRMADEIRRRRGVGTAPQPPPRNP